LKIGDVPKYIVYDDACHLKTFCENRAHISERIRKVCDFKFVIDKMHIQGHIPTKCRSDCHPKNYPELHAPININTVVCEQINFWIGRFKYIVKHMNYFRYIFFHYIIFDLYNTFKSSGKINLSNKYEYNKNIDIKRRYTEENLDLY